MEEVEKEERGKVMKGLGSIALLPSGSISGHFVQLPDSVCYGHHGTDRWEKDVVGMLDEKHGKRKIYISFDCETLKAEDAAEDHIRKFMPKLAGMGAVVNVGPMSITGLEFVSMSITGLEFVSEAEHDQFQETKLRRTSSPVPNRKVEVNIFPTSPIDLKFEEAVHDQIQQKASQDECSQI